MDRGFPNMKRNGFGPEQKSYSMNSTHLFMLMNETSRIISKYSEPEWASDPIAQELVSIVQEYEAENQAELTSVMQTENNCAPNQCQNGAQCVEGQSEYFYYYSFRCECPQGWAGQFCEEEIDECEGNNNNCLNGATCVKNIPSIGGYTCNCAPGWTGSLCEISVDDCAHFPCQNGGQCVDGHQSYTCECTAGFTGTDCEININECQNDPCLNGGTCIDGVNGFTCNCASGFLGPTCETEEVA